MLTAWLSNMHKTNIVEIRNAYNILTSKIGSKDFVRSKHIG
jgi:hypothetical protein